jgi:glucose-induced degradation protein 4
MPSESNPSPPEQSQIDQPTTQVKYCSTCRSPLVDTLSSPVVVHEAICTVCQDPLSSARTGLRRTVTHELYVEVENELVRRAAHDSNSESNGLYIQTRQMNDGRTFHEAMDMEASPTSSSSSSPLSSPSTPTTPYIQYTSHSNKYPPLPAITESESTELIHLIHRTHSGDSSSTFRRQDRPSATSLDPLIDITRLRVRSRGHHCLYPGASFQGTQKSGRNSYDVNVTIVVRLLFSFRI